MEILKDTIKVWGREAQLRMVYEELGELITAVAKYERGQWTHAQVLGEVADVDIVVDQLLEIIRQDIRIRDINDKDPFETFLEIRDFKLARLRQRLDDANMERSEVREVHTSSNNDTTGVG